MSSDARTLPTSVRALSRATLDPMFDLRELELDQIRPLTRREYERLGRLDFFRDERVELLGGVVVKMSPTGRLHTKFEALMVRFFAQALPPDLIALPQCSFPLDDYSEPEPDVYRTITRHDRFAKVQPLLLPDITVCLDDLLK
jgi:Putative restriction endonuclease